MIAKQHVMVGTTFRTYRAISSHLTLKACATELSISAAARIMENIAGAHVSFM